MNPGDRQRPPASPAGGFGGSPWTEAAAGPEKTNENADPRAPFGGDGWTGSPGIATDAVEAQPEPEEPKPTGRRRRNKGPTHTRRTLAALGSSVDLLRDTNGVAHAYAKTERDAYAALGFCMAEDRLWQMDFFRRRASGRSAELLGASAARHDALVRTAGIPRRAAAAASRMDGIARDVLAAFAGGVNAARAIVKPEECERLGYEVEPWTIADSLAIELYLAWSCAVATWPEKLLVARAIAAGGVDRARTIASQPVDFPGTDERVALWGRIDPRIVELVNEPEAGTPMGHVAALGGAAGQLGATFELPLMSPSPLYPVSLDAKDFKVVGVAHVGMPGLLAGRNEDIAWGVTGARIDDADCVMEELDGIGGFRTEAGWEKLSLRRETVRVRDGETLRLEVAETRHGPLLSHLLEQMDGLSEVDRPVAMALCWGANSLGTALPGLLGLARAASAEEAVESAPLLDRSPLALDVAVADADGKVARILGGGRPTRGEAARLPVRGWMSEARWSGLDPLSARSALVEGGPALATGAVGEGGNESVLLHRARRLTEALADAHGAGALDVIATDAKDAAVASVLPNVRSVLEAAGADAGVARAVAALASWDGDAAENSTGAAVFYTALTPHLIDGLLPVGRYGGIAHCRELALASVLRVVAGALGEDERATIVAAFREAEAWLAQNLGSEPQAWTWGRVLTLQADHPCPDPEQLPGIPVAASGSPFTVLGQRFSGRRPPFEIDVATGARVVVDLSTREARIVSERGEAVITVGERPKGERVELISG